MEKINLQYRRPEELRPHEKNLRNNDACVERMMESIREYGFRVPILALSDGLVVDGELRLKAALRLRLPEVPVFPADGMTEIQIRAFRLLVNRSAGWAEWNPEAVAVELAALQALDIPLAGTGFSDRELDAFLQAALPKAEKDLDDAPPPPAEPVSRPGDLWLLGEHRLYCGDARRPESYAALLGDEPVQCVWTDPPYNVAYQGKAGGIKNDSMSDAAFTEFLQAVFDRLFAVMEPGSPVYVAHADAGACGLAFRKTFLRAGFKLASCLVWRKNQPVLSRADYHWQHEPILYGWKPGGPHRWHGDRKQRTVLDVFPTAVQAPGEDGGTVWHIADGERVFAITGTNVAVEELPGSVFCVAKPARSEEHPTMKPVALIAKMLANSSKRGDCVLDAFGGSGSTLITCETMGRVCRIMEDDPRFVDVICLRWQAHSGRAARLAASGQSFAEARAERLPARMEAAV